MDFRCAASSVKGPSDEESLAGAIHLLVIVHPLKLAMLAVKGALLHAAQLQGEAWAQLLQPGHHPPRLLLLARIPLLLLLKDVAVVPAGRTTKAYASGGAGKEAASACLICMQQLRQQGVEQGGHA